MAIYFWLCLSALAAGMINAIAGGGTLLTFPALLAVISPVAANVTSTLALLPGSIASVWGYRREFYASRRWIALLTVPSLLGGVAGALLITQLEEGIFKALVPWLVLLAAILFLVQPAVSRLVRSRSSDEKIATASASPTNWRTCASS